MIHVISTEGALALQAALSGTYSLELNGGEIRVVCNWLPGRAVAAATQDLDGVVWVCIDLDKPLATRSGWAMLREWRKKYLGMEMPVKEERKPCPLSLVS